MLEVLTPSRSGGLPRRRLLQAGGAGLFGLSLPGLLRAEAAQPSFTQGRAKSVVFLFLFGGPSQHETFDLKPLAPDNIRGHFQPIASRTPGLQICEHLPRLAERSDKFGVIRTMSHDYHDHSGGGHYLQTGKRWHIPIGGGFNATPQDWPAIGAVADYVLRRQPGISQELPHYAVVPNFLGRLENHSFQLIRPGEYGGWLGRGYDPVTTRVDKKFPTDNPYFRECVDEELTFQLAGLNSPIELTHDRLSRRQTLLQQFDEQLSRLDQNKTVSVFDEFRQRALNLVTSARTREALDVKQESAETRDRYGRNLFGQATLVARRLVEAGVRFVTVHWEAVDGYSWDSHRNADDVKKHLLPGFDRAASSLLDDLEQRGLLDETLVIGVGEMGRTHQMNRTGGRDHWATLFPALLAGAGVRGGAVLGESDKVGAYPATVPYAPERLAATVYQAMGIDPELRLPDAFGRPVTLLENAEPITEIFG